MSVNLPGEHYSQESWECGTSWCMLGLVVELTPTKTKTRSEKFLSAIKSVFSKGKS